VWGRPAIAYQGGHLPRGPLDVRRRGGRRGGRGRARARIGAQAELGAGRRPFAIADVVAAAADASTAGVAVAAGAAACLQTLWLVRVVAVAAAAVAWRPALCASVAGARAPLPALLLPAALSG
jgi:hypothetical protein